MNPQERDFIEEVLAGDLAEDSPDFLQALERNPGMQIELDEIRTLMGRLDAEAEAEREAMNSPAPLAGATASKKGPMTLPKGLLAAAALVVALFMLNGLFQEDRTLNPTGNPDTLGTSSDLFQELSPMGGGSSFAEFRGTAKIPKHLRIQLRIWDDAASPTEQPSWTHEIQQDERTPDGFLWSPPSEVLAAFPDSIRWKVRLLSLDGAKVDESVMVSASH